MHIRAKVALGAPPRMRGKAFSVLRRQFRFRITPAYAGKRFRWRATRQCEQDHPRVCGEKVLAAYHPAGIPGSPPHMRGKDHPPAYFSIFRGITPAYAGKRRVVLVHSAVHWDHPRVCGEKSGPFRCCFLALGSPPRMRGKAMGSHNTQLPGRITPAYAGKSGPCGCQCSGHGDHPRVCGEKLMTMTMCRE